MFQSKINLPILIACLVFLVASSCEVETILAVDKTKKISSEELSFPSVKYRSLIWLPIKGLAAFSSDIYQPSTQQVKYAFEGDTELHYLPLPPDPNCLVFTRYIRPRLLADGRMGIQKACGQDDLHKDANYLLAYDWDSRETKQIIASPLPSTISGTYSWNPDMTSGVMDIFDGLNGTLFWISPQGVQPMELTLSDGKRSWSLASAYPDFPDYSSYGIAFSPAWSPDGKTIAFWVSFEVIGWEGLSRADAGFDLIFLDSSKMTYSIVLKNIYYPFLLDWSPDGEWLVFRGRIALSSQDRLWLFSPKDKKLEYFAEGYFDDVVWYPDGRKVAVIYCYDVLCDKQTILEYDLTGIISK